MSSIPALRLLFATADRGEAEHAARSRRTDESADTTSTREQTDDPIVAAIRAGDATAFEQLFRAQYAGLARFAHAVVDDDATDVVEDVFAWLWESRARLRVHGSVTTYLYSAVRHRALNVARNRRKQLDLQSRFARDIAEATAPRSMNDNTDDDASLADAVRVVIARLPERRRVAITLRWEGGLSNAEIAEVLGVAPQSVANLIQRALADIRSAFPAEFA